MTINWNRRSYTKEEFTTAWNTSKSIAECARKLQLTVFGGAYVSLKSAASDLGLSNNHMAGQNWWTPENRPKTPKRSLSEVLIYGKYENTSNLKKRLYDENIKEKQCERCGLSEWLGNPAPLSLDHIDGDRLNNRIENLRILCYNCHGQTETYCGKNQGRVAKLAKAEGSNPLSRDNNPNASSNLVMPTCLDCSKKISKQSLRCKSCAGKQPSKNPTKIVWPSIEELQKRLLKSNYTKLGKELGVTDNAIRKHLKKYAPMVE